MKINNKGYLSWIENYYETSKIYLYFITGGSQYSYLLKCSNLCNIFRLKNEKKRWEALITKTSIPSSVSTFMYIRSTLDQEKIYELKEIFCRITSRSFSSTSVERVFSILKTVKQNRQSLSQEVIENNLFFRFNKKFLDLIVLI